MGNSSNGINKLARVLTSRMGKHSEQPLNLDFGTIKKNGTLQTNTFPVNIQKSDYSILKHCKSDLTEGESVRVLVSWVEDEPVVVGVLDNLDN